MGDSVDVFDVQLVADRIIPKKQTIVPAWWIATENRAMKANDFDVYTKQHQHQADKDTREKNQQVAADFQELQQAIISSRNQEDVSQDNSEDQSQARKLQRHTTASMTQQFHKLHLR